MCGIAFGCGLVDEGRIRETNYDQGYSGRWWKQGNDEKHGFVCIAPQRFATSRCPAPCFHQCPHRVNQLAKFQAIFINIGAMVTLTLW